MGIAEKIANAKKTTWITDGIPDEEVKKIIESAKAEAKEKRNNPCMTQEEYDALPIWAKSSLKKCKCGKSVALFYDENRNYRIECIECGTVMQFTASSVDEAKTIWNNSDLVKNN